MSNIVIVNGINVIEELEKAQKELEELKREHVLTVKLFNSANEKLNSIERDVKRYFEILLDKNELENRKGHQELNVLETKLSKAGKEE